MNRNHVIDARNYKKSKARYANDARGLQRIKGFLNNAVYIEKDGRVFIESTRDIAPGEEILVNYGKEYWDAIRYNQKISAKKINNGSQLFRDCTLLFISAKISENNNGPEKYPRKVTRVDFVTQKNYACCHNHSYHLQSLNNSKKMAHIMNCWDK